MKKLVLVFLVALLPAAATAANLPTYDSAAYCKETATSGGGSHGTFESGCMDVEKKAQDSLAAIDIEPKILSFCDKVAKTAGGSYTILQGCVKMEIEPKKSLAK